jgi:hypothetical protein
MEEVKKEKTIAHPMEEVLGIPENTTVVEYTEVLPAVPVASPQYDAKDGEIEGKIEEIYAFAMAKVATVADQIEIVEGKYRARLGEVTANMLNVALGAVREKRELKQHKDKIAVVQTEAGTPRSITNNNVILTRNELLDLLANKNKKSGQ